jgi:hypothetical protein
MVSVRERHPLVVLPVFLALVLALAIPLSAQNQAVVPDIGFEIEGNAALDQGGDYDWENVDRPPGVLIQDPNSKAEPDPSTFRPNSKFDQPESWSIVQAQVGPGQNELTNILSWLILPGGLGEDRPDDLWLVLGMERTKQEGTFDLDFEFNQNPWDGSSGGPNRTEGDLVVGFELKGNPTDKEKDLQVLILQFVPDPDKQPELCDVTPGIPNVPALVKVGTDPCPPYGDSGWWYRFLADGAILADSGLGQATMNEDPFSVPEWWPSTDAQGNPRDVIGPFQFAEAAINLTELGIVASCSTFSSVHAKSRSSLEVESDLKDLAGPVPLSVNCRLDGHKFLDLNGNGSWEPDEPGLPNWEIRLNDGSVMTYTNQSGYYEFNYLADGTYRVYEVCPVDWLQTAPGFTDRDACGTEDYTATLSLDHREVNDLDFGDARPELDVAKTCTADVFWGDDIEYQVTVSNTGNVPLLGVVVDDPVTGLSETVDLAPGESRTFTGTYYSIDALGSLHSGNHYLFLPLIMRGPGQPDTPVSPPTFVAPGTITNTVTATTEFAQVTLEDADSCVTNVHVLEVSKDAQTSFTRTYYWTIDKMVDDPGPITLLPGASATPQYTVTVNLDVPPYVDGDWAVEGTITVDNPAPLDAELESVTDIVSPNIAATVRCPSQTIPAGGSLTCTYDPVQLPDGTNRTNTATATLNNNNGRTTDFSGSASVDFSRARMEEIDEEVQVFDEFWERPPPPEYLGTVRYDEVPVTFTFTRTIPAPGSICGLFEVPNEAFLVTNDTDTVIPDDANVRVEILELCRAAFGFEDLPSGAAGIDWDYNDWVATVELEPTVSDPSAGGDLLRMDFSVQPEARGASYDHAFSLNIPSDGFGCDGTATLTRFDGEGNVLFSESGPFDASIDNEFQVLPRTSDVFPPLSNTDEAKPYVPAQRTALLSIVFDEPCPFEPPEFDQDALIHGEGLFFSASLYVYGSKQTIRPGDERIVLVPVQWKWPEERIPVWEAYPLVQEGDPPIFAWAWWTEWTDAVYDGKP